MQVYHKKLTLRFVLFFVLTLTLILISDVRIYAHEVEDTSNKNNILFSYSLLDMNYLTESKPEFVDSHNVILSKIRIGNNLAPVFQFNINVRTTFGDLIAPSKQIPIISLKVTNVATVTPMENKLLIVRALLILILSAFISTLLILVGIFIKPLINEPRIKKTSSIKYQVSSIKYQVSSIKYQVSSIKYRPDIDALRAIAVSFVLFFHFNEFILPGGFIGVDVFFVISGFLITQMIYNEAVVGAFSFKLFYARRIKRILPTLYLMLLAVGLVGIWILSPGDNVALSESINANLLYFYNFYLINSGHGYFDNPSNQQFLLHTWSLAVEEQFYFFFPIILIISLKFFKKRNYILYFTAFIFMTSLLISCYTSYKFPSYAYYMLPSRAFELLMGCLLSLYCSLYYQKGIRAKGLQSKTYSGLISVVGLSMILISGFCLDKDTTFPGFWGLLPAFGAVLFIFAGILNKSNLINKTLANKCFVFIGLISYSLYIWHWPILAFFRYENPGKVISLYTGIILFLIILLISIFNYLFVEKRLRKVKLSYQKTISLLLVLPFLIILVISTILHSGIIKKSSRINLENQMPDGYCFNGKAGNCVFGYDPINSKTDIMLFGDSHAAAFSPFFEEIGKQNKFNIFMQSYSGCPPILNFDNSGYSGLIGSCDKSSAVFKVDLTKYKTIVLAGYWSAYVKNPSFINDFKKTLTYLEGQKKNVIIIGDVPNYTYGIIENIKRQRILNDSLGRDLGIESVVLTPINKLDNNLIRNISNKHRNTSFYDFESDLLDIRTYPFYNGYLLYADSNHLNPHGAYILAKTISPHNLLLELHHSLKN